MYMYVNASTDYTIIHIHVYTHIYTAMYMYSYNNFYMRHCGDEIFVSIYQLV